MDSGGLKRSVLIVATFSSFITPFMGAAINLALPDISSDLGANAVQLNWIVTIYMLATAIFLLPFGRLGDIVGRKKVFLAGLLLLSLSTFLILFTRSITGLLVFRAIQGISSALIFGTSMAIITSVFPPGERGRAMGINITAVYAGLSSGPLLGGLLTEQFGWRSIFLVLVPISLSAAILTWRNIKTEWAEAREGKTNFSLLYKNRVFALSSLASMIHYTATAGIGFFLSLYLQYLRGYDARSAGMILMIQPVMMALLSIYSGKLSDRINPGYLASAGMAITSLGIFALTFINESTSIVYIMLILAFNGIGFALFSTPNSNAIMSSVEKKFLGIASGMLGTVRMIGQTSSLAIAMMLITIFIGHQKIVPENFPELLTTIKTGLVIFSVICIPAIFASLARNRNIK